MLKRSVRAIVAQLAPDDAFSLARSGHVLTYLGHEVDMGASMIEEAFGPNPDLASAWYSQGWVTMMWGRGESGQSFHTSKADPARPSARGRVERKGLRPFPARAL